MEKYKSYSYFTRGYQYVDGKGRQWCGGRKNTFYINIIMTLGLFLAINFLLFKLLFGEDYFDNFTNVRSILQPRGDIIWSANEEDFRNKIVLALVVCSKPGNTQPRQEAAVMIKSVVISSMLYGTPGAKYNTASSGDSQWWIEIHLFLEHNEDVDYFHEQLVKYGYPFDDLWVDLHFHSASDAIPEKFRAQMVNDRQFRCMYVRDFLPNALEEVDFVLYVDTDVIFTGNLMTVWDYRLNMKGEHLIAVAPDVADDNPMNSTFYGKIPVPPPKGLNSGVLLMNLTRMRATTWTSRVLQIHQDYSRIAKRINDQMLLNILLYYDSSLLLRMPCHYNFWFMHCYEGYYCSGALEDPLGIQVIHGASTKFAPGQPLHHVYSYYEAFNFTMRENLASLNFTRDLMLPIREAYQSNLISNYNQQELEQRNHGQCDGTIDKVLFKNYFSVT